MFHDRPKMIGYVGMHVSVTDTGESRGEYVDTHGSNRRLASARDADYYEPARLRPLGAICPLGRDTPARVKVETRMRTTLTVAGILERPRHIAKHPVPTPACSEKAPPPGGAFSL